MDKIPEYNKCYICRKWITINDIKNNNYCMNKNKWIHVKCNKKGINNDK